MRFRGNYDYYYTFFIIVFIYHPHVLTPRSGRQVRDAGLGLNLVVTSRGLGLTLVVTMGG